VRELAPFRNREAAFTLATFIARFWSVPGRVALAFAIDRRELADRDGLDLTEARIRGALKTLEAIGFLDRAIPPPGSRYKATADGLHRRPIKFVFGSEYAPAFLAANTRARKAKGGDPHARRPIAPSPAPRPSTRLSVASGTSSPKSKASADPVVNLGELKRQSGLPAEPSAPTALERALQQLSEGVFGKPRGFQNQNNT
jgi:hypothetical protein